MSVEARSEDLVAVQVGSSSCRQVFLLLQRCLLMSQRCRHNGRRRRSTQHCSTAQIDNSRHHGSTKQEQLNYSELEMWANAQRGGRPAECRWRPLFNAAVWLTPTTRVPCSNAAKTQNPLKFAGVPQTCQQISAVSRPKFTVL